MHVQHPSVGGYQARECIYLIDTVCSVLPYHQHHHRISGLAYSGVFRPTDGRLAACGDDSGVVTVFDVASKSALRSLKGGEKSHQGHKVGEHTLSVWIVSSKKAQMKGRASLFLTTELNVLPTTNTGGGARGAVAAGRAGALLRLRRQDRGTLYKYTHVFLLLLLEKDAKS